MSYYNIKYRGLGEDYSGDGDGPVDALQTVGCGCCGVYVPITEESLDEAISDAREWIELLETKKEELKRKGS